MTTEEFRSWFLGFCAGIGDRPTANQWQRVKDRMSQLNGLPTTETDFVHLYRDVPGIIPTAIKNLATTEGGLEYDSLSAMLMLGKFETRT